MSPLKYKITKEKYQLMSTIDTNVEDYNYQLVLVYASSGCPYKELVDDLKKMLQPEMKIIITGDFNFDRKESNSLTTFLQGES